MPVRRRKLRQSQSVALDANGDGVIRFGPVPPHDIYEIRRIMVSIVGDVFDNPGAVAKVYDSYDLNVAALIDGTLGGGLDVAEYPEGQVVLTGGEYLSVEWDDKTGDSASNIATATIFGWEIQSSEYFA